MGITCQILAAADLEHKLSTAKVRGCQAIHHAGQPFVWKENKWPAVMKETGRVVMGVVDSPWVAEGEVFYCKGLGMSTISAWAHYALQFVFYSFARVQKSSHFTRNLSPAPPRGSRDVWQVLGLSQRLWSQLHSYDTIWYPCLVFCFVVQYLCNTEPLSLNSFVFLNISYINIYIYISSYFLGQPSFWRHFFFLVTQFLQKSARRLISDPTIRFI